MGTWFRTAVVSAMVLALGAAPALAGGGGKTSASEEKAGGAATPGTESSGAAATGEFKGQHTMTGEVTRIDEKKGRLSLKTPEGTMDLHFPPAALQNIKKGDRVTVQLAIKEAGGGSASPATGGSSGKSMGGGTTSPSTPSGSSPGSRY